MFPDIDGLDCLPKELLKKMFDDVWKCIYCNSKFIDYKEPCTCKKCHRTLGYLNTRMYGRDLYKLQINGYDGKKAFRFYWKRLPLWML